MTSQEADVLAEFVCGGVTYEGRSVERMDTNTMTATVRGVGIVCLREASLAQFKFYAEEEGYLSLCRVVTEAVEENKKRRNTTIFEVVLLGILGFLSLLLWRFLNG